MTVKVNKVNPNTITYLFSQHQQIIELGNRIDNKAYIGLTIVAALAAYITGNIHLQNLYGEMNKLIYFISTIILILLMLLVILSILIITIYINTLLPQSYAHIKASSITVDKSALFYVDKLKFIIHINNEINDRRLKFIKIAYKLTIIFLIFTLMYFISNQYLDYLIYITRG